MADNDDNYDDDDFISEHIEASKKDRGETGHKSIKNIPSEVL